MNPEDKVPTLWQCKRLVELGVVLKTEKCWWVDNHSKESGVTDNNEFVEKAKKWLYKDQVQYIFYPAPDVAELGEVLNLNNGFEQGAAENEKKHRPQQTFDEWWDWWDTTHTWEVLRHGETWEYKSAKRAWEASEKNRGYEEEK